MGEKLEFLTHSKEMGIVDTCSKYGVSIDIFTTARRSLTTKEKLAIALLFILFPEHQYLENLVIRSGSGSQFIAKNVCKYLRLIGGNQKFTFMPTPQENEHIETYHVILEKKVFQRFKYRTFKELNLQQQMTLWACGAHYPVKK